MTDKPSAVASLEAMIADSPTLQSTRSGAVVALARMLADQVDASTGGPSTRLAASYLSILKDLRRLVTDDPKPEKKAGRLTLIKQQAAAARQLTEQPEG